MATSYQITTEQHGDVTVVTLAYAIIRDEDGIQLLGSELFLVARRQKNVLLNLGAVDAVASSFLGKLNSLNRIAQEAGGKLVLCSLTPHLSEVFETTKLNKVLTLCGTQEEGLAAFLEQPS